MKRPGAIAAASMALYSREKMAEMEVAKAAPLAKRKRPAHPAGRPAARWHPPDDYALVSYGAGSTQLAQVLDVDRSSATIRKWARATARWTKPAKIPIGRLIGRPAKNDPRLLAARASNIIPMAPPLPEITEGEE